MQEVHVACPCCKNKRLFDADPEAVEALSKLNAPFADRSLRSASTRKRFVLSESAYE